MNKILKYFQIIKFSCVIHERYILRQAFNTDKTGRFLKYLLVLQTASPNTSI